MKTRDKNGIFVYRTGKHPENFLFLALVKEETQDHEHRGLNNFEYGSVHLLAREREKTQEIVEKGKANESD